MKIFRDKNDKCHDEGINPEFIKNSNDSDNSENIGEEFWHSWLSAGRAELKLQCAHSSPRDLGKMQVLIQ